VVLLKAASLLKKKKKNLKKGEKRWDVGRCRRFNPRRRADSAG